MSRPSLPVLLFAAVILTTSCTFLGPNGYTSTYEYVDRVSFRAVGPQDGGIAADGYTKAGRRNYPSAEF